jgi:SAM-dependent methyltransferase
MQDSDSSYQFGSGIGGDEVARLEVQGKALAPATRMIFAEAGIRPGMRVLDLGCGAGDAAFVAADLVGPGGSVVGVDRSPDALARARLRAGQRSLTQVQFIEGDIHDPVPGGPSTPSSSGWSCCGSPTRPWCFGGRLRCCARAAWSFR